MRPVRAQALLALGLLVAGCGGGREEAAGGGPAQGEGPTVETPTVIRVALFNVEELSTDKLGQVGPDGSGLHPQARAAAAIVQRVRPDVLVLNEIDLDEAALTGVDLDGAEAPEANARRFAHHYLSRDLARDGEPMDYPYAFAAPCNTGILSGHDLDGDGVVATPADRGSRLHGGDSFGYGTYPGQYAMAVLSRFPLAAARARTFQSFRWRDLPGHHLPGEFYSPREVEVLRLSSKSHWDLPVVIGGRTLHLWISHPTPPAFDGPEDRNGRRNFDEIRFWVAYLEGEPALVDDAGRRGGYGSQAPFLIAGDLNASPGDPAVVYDGISAIDQLLSHPRVQDTGPVLTSTGALAGRTPGPPSYPERNTATFLEGRRVDYLLPSRELEVVGGGVFWPAAEEDPEGHRLAEEASDHRLIWLDLALPPS